MGKKNKNNDGRLYKVKSTYIGVDKPFFNTVERVYEKSGKLHNGLTDGQIQDLARRGFDVNHFVYVGPKELEKAQGLKALARNAKLLTASRRRRLQPVALSAMTVKKTARVVVPAAAAANNEAAIKSRIARVVDISVKLGLDTDAAMALFDKPSSQLTAADMKKVCDGYGIESKSKAEVALLLNEGLEALLAKRATGRTTPVKKAANETK